MNTAGSYLLSKRFYITAGVLALWFMLVILCFFTKTGKDGFEYMRYATIPIIGLLGAYLGFQSVVQAKQNAQTGSVTQTVAGTDTTTTTVQETVPPVAPVVVPDPSPAGN